MILQTAAPSRADVLPFMPCAKQKPGWLNFSTQTCATSHPILLMFRFGFQTLSNVQLLMENKNRNEFGVGFCMEEKKLREKIFVSHTCYFYPLPAGKEVSPTKKCFKVYSFPLTWTKKLFFRLQFTMKLAFSGGRKKELLGFCKRLEGWWETAAFFSEFFPAYTHATQPT